MSVVKDNAGRFFVVHSRGDSATGGRATTLMEVPLVQDAQGKAQWDIEKAFIRAQWNKTSADANAVATRRVTTTNPDGSAAQYTTESFRSTEESEKGGTPLRSTMYDPNQTVQSYVVDESTGKLKRDADGNLVQQEQNLVISGSDQGITQHQSKDARAPKTTTLSGAEIGRGIEEGWLLNAEGGGYVFNDDKKTPVKEIK